MTQIFPALSPGLLGNLANIAATLIPLGLSLVVWRFFEARYFRTWNLAIVVGLITLLIDCYTAGAGHPVLPTSLACLAYVVANYFYVATAGEFSNQPAWARWYAVLGAVTWLLYLALSAMGLPFEQAFTVGILQFVLAQFLLAWAVSRSQWGHRNARLMLAISCLFMGLTIFLYPLLMHTRYIWVGSFIAAVAHLVCGMAMLVFSLSEVALTLKQANAELRNLDRLQMEFLGNLNHELRTPFQAIQTAVYLLQRGPDSHRLSGQQRETVTLLGDTTDRLFALVTDLVDISAMSQGATTYDFAAHDVSELVDGTIRFLGNLIAERHITVTVDLPSDGLEAEVDDRRLRQVVVNLIANALKFTPPGGAVTVRLRREAEVLRLTVRDTGIGIPSSELERIFQRFYQVDGSSTRQVGGNGLGLAICKAIVEEGHNGRIWAESDGQGSTFTVVLPLEQAAAQTAAPLALSLTVA